MSEIMRPIPFPDLINWAREENKNQGSVFGIRKEKFFRPVKPGDYATLFETNISSPVGPAAGPHSQLAQNILAAYLAGSRVIELKTVQEMDGEDLRKAVSRPCIYAPDEGYNVEWSTELTVPEAEEEYIKAWFLCHIFAKEFGIADKCDFVFNMSTGYSLDGIKSAKIDSFIEGMKNAAQTQAWKCCYEYMTAELATFDHFTTTDLEAISSVVSAGVTLSTLHGCPRDEIEKIAAYLITEKKLHTYIKCNPTLLGYDSARKLLDEMGYSYVSFDDHHFKNDLQFDDAVIMLHRLKTLADGLKLSFGVKISNTFPVQIKRHELPGQEMYMSGRALFPLSINVAKRLSESFNGELPISYSGGADFFNLREILETGIKPVTVATTILKPGGYERLTQLAEIAASVNSSHRGHKGHEGEVTGKGIVIDVKALTALVESLPGRMRYRKEYRQAGSSSTSLTPHSPLPIFNCFISPCSNGSIGDEGCPINQRIPEYLAAVAERKYDEAFRIIALDNTAPSITGTICDHQCQYKCTRVDYEDPLQIREAKLCAAINAQEAYISSISPTDLKTEKSVAVIGAGPAGIAAAIFLRRNGVPVTVYEKRERPYGIVQYVIPSFRISDDAIFRDFQIAQNVGVEFIFNAAEDFSVSELQKKHQFVIIATGAWKEGASPVKEGREKVIDALRFLEDSKKSRCCLDLGKKVAVIGGGDVAMDSARAAKRNKGVESVTIVYRRTREFMPSQYEEQEFALAEGVEFKELLSPESYINGVLCCEQMRLGDYDNSGRRGIKGTGEKINLCFDTVISAVGSRVETENFTKNGITLNGKGFPEVNSSGESSVTGVYIAGDCRSGAAVVVKAIADGKAAAEDILTKLDIEADFNLPLATNHSPFADLYLKKGVITEAKYIQNKDYDNTDGYRCLSCNILCEVCVDVCPNRANVNVEVHEKHQVLHIDRMCNECGNCAVFCPYPGGKPYKDKLTIFSCDKDFMDSENPGFLKMNEIYKIRLKDKSTVNYCKGYKTIPDDWITMIDTIEAQYGYLIIKGGVSCC